MKKKGLADKLNEFHENLGWRLFIIGAILLFIRHPLADYVHPIDAQAYWNMWSDINSFVILFMTYAFIKPVVWNHFRKVSAELFLAFVIEDSIDRAWFDISIFEVNDWITVGVLVFLLLVKERVLVKKALAFIKKWTILIFNA